MREEEEEVEVEAGVGIEGIAYLARHTPRKTFLGRSCLTGQSSSSRAIHHSLLISHPRTYMK